MPASNDVLKNSLSRNREITITVTGRTSGRATSIPVWFAFENGNVYLLPARGSGAQWYLNVLKNPAIRIRTGGAEATFHGVPVTDPKRVSAIVEKFRGKYGDSGLKLYAKLDAAVVAETGEVPRRRRIPCASASWARD